MSNTVLKLFQICLLFSILYFIALSLSPLDTSFAYFPVFSCILPLRLLNAKRFLYNKFIVLLSQVIYRRGFDVLGDVRFRSVEFDLYHTVQDENARNAKTKPFSVGYIAILNYTNQPVVEWEKDVYKRQLLHHVFPVRVVSLVIFKGDGDFVP